MPSSIFPMNLSLPSCHRYVQTRFNMSLNRARALTKFPWQFSLNDTTFEEDSLFFGSVDNRIVYIRTNKGDVYRSGDYGHEFSLCTNQTIWPSLNLTNSRIWRMMRGAAMPDGTYAMYFWSGLSDSNAGYRQMLWTTFDGGLTFHLRPSVPNQVETVLPHPYFPGVAIAQQRTSSGLKVQLFATSDAFQTTRRIFEPHVVPNRFSWAVSATHPHRLIAGVTLGITSASSAFWNSKVLQTDNYFADYRILMDHVQDWSTVVLPSSTSIIGTPIPPFTTNPQPPSGLTTNSTIFPQIWPASETFGTQLRAAAIRFPSASDYYRTAMEVATEPGYTWERPANSWKKVVLPRLGYYNKAPQGMRTNWIEPSSNYVTVWDPGLYGGNTVNTLFRIDTNLTSLESVSILPKFKSNDLVQFSPIPGSLIANQYLTTSTDTWTGAHFSFLTGNAGARWQRLMAPYQNGTVPKNLVLTGFTNPGPFMYSIPSALGQLFVSATELIPTETHALNFSGPYRARVGTYFTNDAGYTWQKLGPGYLVPEFAANGALAIFARTGVLSDTVVFSLDDGQTWREYQLPNITVRFYNIRVAHDYNSRVLLIHGIRSYFDIYPPPVAPLVDIPQPPPDEDPAFLDPSSPNVTNSTEPQTMEPNQEPSTEPSTPPIASPSSAPSVPPDLTPPSNYTPIEDSSPDTNMTSAPDMSTEPASNETAPVEPPPQEPPSPPFSWESSLIALDFSQSFPLCNESDYEPWTPTDEYGEARCTLGEKIVFKRRKSGHFCFPMPPPDEDQSHYQWPIIVSRTPCECTHDDYECAPCFERNFRTGGCDFVCGLESQTFLSQYGNVPLRPNSCLSTPSGSYSWAGSASLAHKLNPQSKCRVSPLATLAFRDADIPCAYAPSHSNPSPSPIASPSGLSTQARRTLLIIGVGVPILVVGLLLGFHYNRVIDAALYVFDLIMPRQLEQMEMADFDLDEHMREIERQVAEAHREMDERNGVELQPLARLDPTTSSDEDEALLD